MPSPPITIDILIFVAFFLFNIIVGFRHGSKSQSFREYAIGHKKFSTATLTATIVATWMSGSALFINLEKIHEQGLYYGIVDIIATPLGLLIIGYSLGPRMGKFLCNLSVPDVLGKLYGKPVQAIAGITTVLRSIGYIAMQLQVITRILVILFDYDGPEVVTIVAMIITLYALSGGVKAVTFTDILQFFTFGTLLPILALTIWNKSHGYTQISHMFQTNPLFSFKEVMSWSPKSMNSLLFMAYLMTPILQPQLFQRMVMARDTTQIKRSFGYAAIACLGIEFCMVWIAIMITADKPSLDPSKIMPYIVNTYTYPGFKGLLSIGIIALTMSTADSVLNACAVVIANDILPPLGLKKQNKLNMARWATLMLGVLGLVLALSKQDLLNILRDSANLYTPIVAVPMLLAILGFETSKRVVLMVMGAGSAATVVCLFYFKNVHSFFPGLLANLFTMLALHYLLGEKGGWQPLAPNDPLTLERAARRQAWQQQLNAFRKFKLYPYLKQNLPTQREFYFLFGLYALTVIYISCYTTDNLAYQAYQPIYVGIYYAVLPITTALLTFPIWPNQIKYTRFITFFWPLSIGGILFFASTLLMIMSHFHHIQAMIMMINFLMAVLLLRWPLALFLASVGMALAVVFFKQYTGTTLAVSASYELSLKMVCGLLVFIIFLTAFLKGKQAYWHLAKLKVQLSREHSFTSRLMLTMFKHGTAVLQEADDYSLIETETTTKLNVENKILHHAVYQLDTYNRYLKQVLHRTQQPMRLRVQTETFDVLWKKALEEAQQHKKINTVITQHHTTCQRLQADTTEIQRLLRHALIYVATQQRSKQPILLGFEDTQLAYPIIALPGYVKHIRAVRIVITTKKTLPALKKWYLGSADYVVPEWPQGIAALPIAYNQQIVEAHYGHTEMSCQSDEIVLMYVVPWAVREVRPPVMDQWQQVVATALPQEYPLNPTDEAFIKSVQAKLRIDTTLLRQALQFVKQHHGRGSINTETSHYQQALAVAHIVLDYTRDVNTFLAALMHDIIDKTHCSLHQLALYFSPTIQRIVDGVACVDSRLKSCKKIQLSDFETIRKVLEIQDERVLYIKLAMRLQYVRTIGEENNSPAEQRKIAEETLQFFVPLAEKLGLTKSAEELKKYCLVVLLNQTG